MEKLIVVLVGEKKKFSVTKKQQRSSAVLGEAKKKLIVVFVGENMFLGNKEATKKLSAKNSLHYKFSLQ
eukprot:5516564-Ditylum_brightwellii.AAC.1